MADSRDEELNSNNLPPYRGKYKADSSKAFSDAENAPLLAGPSIECEGFRRRHRTNSLDAAFNTPPSNFPHDIENGIFHSSDEPYFFDFIMEKVKSTRLAHLLEKVAAESEPGLTTSQLMLNNHDLKPVEPERRQWGPWNFVGFWVADSFNIVSLKVKTSW
jgi:NCS1 family nucleobase:cation symporter-1